MHYIKHSLLNFQIQISSVKNKNTSILSTHKVKMHNVIHTVIVVC